MKHIFQKINQMCIRDRLGIGAESGDYRIIEKVLPYADEVHELSLIHI